jgi:hypothetical protein
MKSCNVMLAALAGLLGFARCAPGRDVPVYREYTQPIFFYDETGERTAFTVVAPDLLALQSLRDAQGQAGLMGKETLLDLAFNRGSSVFGVRAPSAGMAAGGQEVRRRQDESGRNWLAHSLTLPSLGQMPTNAAASAMSAGAKESSWGWLADEVAAQPDSEAVQPENMPTEENYDPAAAQENMLRGGANPFGTDRADIKVQKEKQKAAEPAPTAAAFPASDDLGQKPSDRSAERRQASARELQGGDRVAATSMQSYRTDSAVAEMSRTRQVMADLSVGARPDFSSLRESLVAGATRTEKSPDGGDAARMLAGSHSEMDLRPSPGGGSSGNWSVIGANSMRVSLPEIPMWQGGWSPQNAGENLSSRLQRYIDPVPQPLVPVPTRESTRPAVSSGGYRPGWY